MLKILLSVCNQLSIDYQQFQHYNKSNSIKYYAIFWLPLQVLLWMKKINYSLTKLMSQLCMMWSIISLTLWLEKYAESQQRLLVGTQKRGGNNYEINTAHVLLEKVFEDVLIKWDGNCLSQPKPFPLYHLLCFIRATKYLAMCHFMCWNNMFKHIKNDWNLSVNDNNHWWLRILD